MSTKKLGKDWRRDRGQVDQALMHSRVILFSTAAMGMMFAVAQHECILWSMDPHAGVMEFLKASNFLLSVALLAQSRFLPLHAH